MTERDFIYWLNGFLELANPNTLNSTQVQIIKDHINLVMKKETPDRIHPLRKSDDEKRESLVEGLLKSSSHLESDCLFCGRKGGHGGLICPRSSATC